MAKTSAGFSSWDWHYSRRTWQEATGDNDLKDPVPRVWIGSDATTLFAASSLAPADTVREVEFVTPTQVFFSQVLLVGESIAQIRRSSNSVGANILTGIPTGEVALWYDG